MSRLDTVVDQVDQNDQVLGTIPRRHVFTAGASFRVTHVLLFADTGELLIQKIADGLRHPGQWGSSVAGYLETGEQYETAARRTLKRELDVVDVDLSWLGRTSMVDSGCTKFVGVFKCMYPGPVTPNPAEIAAVDFVGLDELQRQRRTGTRALTETFRAVLDYYEQLGRP